MMLGYIDLSLKRYLCEFQKKEICNRAYNNCTNWNTRKTIVLRKMTPSKAIGTEVPYLQGSIYKLSFTWIEILKIFAFNQSLTVKNWTTFRENTNIHKNHCSNSYRTNIKAALCPSFCENSFSWNRRVKVTTTGSLGSTIVFNWCWKEITDQEKSEKKPTQFESDDGEQPMWNRK